MKNKIVFWVLCVLGILFMLINTLVMWVIAAGVWIYLIVKIKKTGMFKREVESETSKIHLKRLKIFLRSGGVMFFVSIVSLIGHNMISGRTDPHDPISFIIVLVSMYIFIILIAGGFFTYQKEKGKI